MKRADLGPQVLLYVTALCFIVLLAFVFLVTPPAQAAATGHSYVTVD